MPRFETSHQANKHFQEHEPHSGRKLDFIKVIIGKISNNQSGWFELLLSDDIFLDKH